MDESDPTASIIAFLLLLFLEIIFYAFGSAVQELKSMEMRERSTEKNDCTRKLIHIMEHPGKFIHTTHLITAIVAVITGLVHVSLLSDRFILVFTNVAKQQTFLFGGLSGVAVRNISVILAVCIFSYIILTFGILLPKKIAAKYAVKVAYGLVYPVYIIMLLGTPFTAFITVTASFFARIFGVSFREDSVDVTEEEIISMVNEGHEQGVFQTSEVEMINRIFDFTDKEAKDIMTHRSNIVGIDADTSLRDAVMFMLEEKSSRYPVYEDNIDHIMGIIHIKDACRALELEQYVDRPIKEFPELIRDANFIPETRNIDTLFKTMQMSKNHIVIVIDEYGQTAGLIAMEDILEEIVGNILDEYDDEEIFIVEIEPDVYEMDGLTPISKISEKTGIHFEDEDFETLNGLIISRLEKIPEANEVFEMDYEGYTFKVLHVENKMVKKVLVSKIKDENRGDS